MQPRITEVLTYLETRRAALESTLAEVQPALRELRPSPESWSVAEVIQHLALTEGRVTEVVAHCIDRVLQADVGPESETSPVGTSFDIGRVLDRSRPVVAGESVLPRELLDTNAAWPHEASRARHLRRWSRAREGDRAQSGTGPARRLPVDTLCRRTRSAPHGADPRDRGAAPEVRRRSSEDSAARVRGIGNLNYGNMSCASRS